MHLVVEVAADQDPPDCNLAAEAPIEDGLCQLIRCKAGNEAFPIGAKALKAREKVEILRPCRNVREPGAADHGLQGAIGKLPEEPSIRIDDVLRQICKAHGLRGEAPIFVSLGHAAKSLQGGFANCR